MNNGFGKTLTGVIAVILTAAFLFAPINLNYVSAKETLIGTVYNTGTGLRVRTLPSTTGSVEGGLLDGEQVTVLSQSEDANGDIWYRVTYQDSSKKTVTGYVFGEYLKVTTVITPDPEPETPAYTSEEDFENAISVFPEDYRVLLRKIHELYPNYYFRADYTGTDFDDALTREFSNYQKVVRTSPYSWADGTSWRAMDYNYNSASGYWYESPAEFTTASREVIAYYMDPRNFLDTDNIAKLYIFLDQKSFEESDYTRSMLEDFLKGSFMAYDYEYDEDDPDEVRCGGSYINVLMDVSEKLGFNPLLLAATIFMEQGRTGSTMCDGNYPGYENVYNFFNYAAAGSSVIVNGLRYALNQGWTNRYRSIYGGAEQYVSQYVNKGQNTYFYKDWHVYDSTYYPLYTHEYASAVYDAAVTAYQIAGVYEDFTEAKLTFNIPVFNNMPEVPRSYPAENGKLNNYYFSALQMPGLNEAFDRLKYNYSASVSGDTSLLYGITDGAAYTGPSQFNLSKGSNTVYLTVRSETGYDRMYTINIEAARACVLTVTQGFYANTLVNYNGTWTWFGDGCEPDYSYCGFASNSSGDWYVKAGEVDFETGGIFAGTVNGEYGRWLVKDSKVQYISTISYDGDEWIKITDGKEDKGFTGVARNENGWWRVENGKVNFKAFGVYQNENGWWRVEDGKVNFTATGIYQNENGWWRVESGKVNFAATGIYQNENGWWRVEGGKVNFAATGIYQNENGWWYVEGGKVNFNFTGLAENENGRWYCENGRVMFGWKGLAKDENGTWYVSGGKVDLSFSGVYEYDGKLWDIKEGLVTGEHTEQEQPEKEPESEAPADNTEQAGA